MPLLVPIMRHRTFSVAVAIISLTWLTACNGPRAIHEQPILVTGDRVPNADSLIAIARANELAKRDDARLVQDSITAAATSNCAPSICAAIARGEVSLGMSGSQVLAATRTTPHAWSIRNSGNTTVFTPASFDAEPRDTQGSLAMVQLADDRVTSVAWRERSGLRVVSSPADTGAAARSRVLADALIREGDDFIAAGDRDRALERYDRALVMKNDDAMLNYKVAQLLDQQLRPVEALMRYQRFLLSLDLQRIEAQGTQNAKLAEAIAIAQQRVIVLDRRPR
jgi:tetratricopeptide (TPR) repeat protein